MIDPISVHEERKVRAHVVPRSAQAALEEFRALNFDLEPLFSDSESFRLSLPGGKLVEVRFTELVPWQSADLVMPARHLPSMENVLLSICKLKSIIDHE